MTNDEQTPELSRKLWTPWRMTYVGGGAKESGCVFCNRLAADNDVESLILFRTVNAFIIMNLFPYNTGHLMIVPNAHLASPEEIDPEVLSEMAGLQPPVLRALRGVLNCDGFNLGLNVGSVAGAGMAEHLHQHIVPRWTGDANFMPILGAAIVMPELIPVTYAKIRAELPRELPGNAAPEVALVVITPARDRALLNTDGSLPAVHLERARPASRQAVEYLATRGVASSVGGWAGTNLADGTSSSALTMFGAETPVTDGRWIDLSTLGEQRSEVQTIIRRGLAQLAPTVGPASSYDS